MWSLFPILMSNGVRNLTVMPWNVRGLGDSDKCTVVRDAIFSASPSIACLQERKLSEISAFKENTFLPRTLRIPSFSIVCQTPGGGHVLGPLVYLLDLLDQPPAFPNLRF